MKKIISLLLTLVMVFTLAVPAFAAERVNSDNYYKPDYDGYPIIVVRGINFGGLINEKDGSLAMQFKAEDIFSLLSNMLKGAVIDKNEDFFIDSVIDFVWGLMGNLASDKDGTSLNEDITAEYFTKSLANYNLADKFDYATENGMAHTAAEIAGDEHAYFFNYDWRLSPEELAAQLSELVETAKKDAGKDKVKIVCASMGGMVATAYLYYYGNDSVDSCTYLCAAHNGTYVAGSALSGNIEIMPEAMNNIFSSLASGNGAVVDFLMKALDKIGVYKLLAFLLNKFIDNNIEKVYDEFLRGAFATSVGLWALCPDEYFDSAVDYMFSGYEEEYPVLLEKLEECERFVKSTEKTLAKAEKDGVKLAFITNYNMGLVPVYPESVLQGDMVLEAELTSNFATFANQGETLSEDYLKNADSRYVSPEKDIDASTALYKDCTWFVKNANHVACDYGTQYSDFVFSLLMAEKQPSLAAFPQYPQFMVADKELNLQPLAVN
ncbi:MAG: hypothetical protein IJW86_07945 [Clostridia bacterium]|nr:hypothetical protein [Clostridia bacterium]